MFNLKYDIIMNTYIKKSVPGYYFELEETLSPELYNIGTTYEDFLNNCFIKLSNKQLKFRNNNPNASIEEVINAKLKEAPIKTLEQVKFEKLMEIDVYDNSEEVNCFTINNAIPAWFTPTERSNYKSSIDAAKLLGVNELSFFIGNTSLSVPTESAERMLAAIQLYADACFMVTKQHMMNVEALDSIEEINAYDYKTGYPEKLNFDLV